MKAKSVILKFVVIPVVVLLLVVVVVFIVAGNTLIKAGIETAGSKTLGVPVTLKSVNLSLLRGRVDIKGLVIKNPPGYANDTLLDLGEGMVNLDIGSLLSNTIKIELIKLNGTKLTMEQKGLTNNLKEILDRLPKEEKTETTPAEKGKDLHIDKLEITNTNVNVKLIPIPGKIDTVSMNIDPIVMTDLGTNKKLKMGELMARILGAIATGVARQGAGKLPGDMVSGITSAVGSGAEMGKAAVQQGQKIIETSTGAGKDVIKGVTNLFGGKKSEPNK
jgi:hypothetical protein